MTKHDKELLDTIFLQPWFLPRNTALAIRRILPPEHRHRMRFYFEDYGCMKCGKTDVPYGSNALCKLCMQKVRLRLFFAIRRRWTAAVPDNLPRTFKRIADAQQLLKDLLETSARRGRGKGAKRGLEGTRSKATS